MSAAKSTPIEAAEVPFARARAHAGRAEGRLSSSEMIRAPHSEVEALCEAEGREWARLVLEEHLALRAAQERRVEVTGADGVARGYANAVNLDGGIDAWSTTIDPTVPRY